MTKPKVIMSRASDNKWENKGLRSFLEYRNLGIEEATGGKFGGNIARALQAKKATDHAALHYHTVGFHLTMVLRGWMRTYYDGLGEVIMNAGDCVTYRERSTSPTPNTPRTSRCCRSPCRGNSHRAGGQQSVTDRRKRAGPAP